MTVAAPASKLSVRLPRGVKGHAFATGRYRITVTAVDATGTRSASVHRALRVMPRGR